MNVNCICDNEIEKMKILNNLLLIDKIQRVLLCIMEIQKNVFFFNIFIQ